ncbi:MAG: response regulator [Bacteroidia bacterium]
MNGPIKVFIIANDPQDPDFFLEAVSQMPFGVKCEFAENAFVAFERINNDKDFDPDLIIIDINMPLMNGITCLRVIKKIERLKKKPVYMWSTSAYESVSDVCKSYGARGFIIKPANVELMRKSLLEIFKPEKNKVL